MTSLSNYGTVNFQGVEYALITEASLTNRVFPGWWGDAKDGEEYASEFSAKAVDAEGNEYIATWQFDQTKGAEIDDDCLDWDSVHTVVTA